MYFSTEWYRVWAHYEKVLKFPDKPEPIPISCKSCKPILKPISNFLPKNQFYCFYRFLANFWVFYQSIQISCETVNSKWYESSILRYSVQVTRLRISQSMGRFAISFLIRADKCKISIIFHFIIFNVYRFKFNLNRSTIL